jgi:ABC-type branched-subunit amino acid transport system ATPase component
MAWFGGKGSGRAGRPTLVVEGLDVYYGRAHALQGVNLQLDHGVLGIVGRNGMGKTTLCNAITGLVPAGGSVKLFGEEVLGLSPHQITRRGIAYVPQGRRVWPSLSVDETLRLVAPKKRDVDRIYTMFPRLAERRGNGGAQLSGGEQQMLAIGRALLLQPRLLVMDEPTEGLAPVIVEQVEKALRQLADDGEIAVLLIEQNLGVAIEVADRIGVMVNGRIAQELPSAELAADRGLQERLLGVRAGGVHDEADDDAAPAPATTRPKTTLCPRPQPTRPKSRSSPCAARMATAALPWTTWRRAPCAASTAGTAATRARRWPTCRARLPRHRLHRHQRRPRACSSFPLLPAPAAPPTWRAPSTPRRASCSSCANAWRSWACAW